MNWNSVNKLPNQTYVSRVYEEEHRRIEGDWLRRQFAHGHPSGRERKQRHGKQMREIEPQQARGRLSGIAHEIVMISPDDGDKQVANRVAQPCGPKRQERLEG